MGRPGAGVVPVHSHAESDFLDDPQIGLGIARWGDGLFAHLHHAVGVAHRACFFWPRRCGQHHIGQPSGFGHENVLHHQMV